MAHEQALADLGIEWAESVAATERVRDRLAAAVRAAADAGMTEYRIVQVTGAARATIRRWLGK